MNRLMIIVLSALAAAPVLSVSADPGNAQFQARRDMRAGNVRSLREIERLVLPTRPGMEYLGPEYDPVAMIYRLKFIRDGRVVFVDVDARSGNIIGQSR
ncbi:MAG: PepSY domain-containing protein [Novosphingobium sp.]|nr:PepSY domain-containing protein [Novosphingobium sp.]